MTDARPNLLLLVTSSAWGGAERYVLRMAEAASAEFDVTVAAGPSASRELFRRLPPGVRAAEIPDLTRPISPWRDLKAFRQLQQLIDGGRFDLVHANSSKAGLLGTVAAHRSKRQPPVIYTAHGWGFTERRPLPFRLAVLAGEKAVSRWRSATVTLTEAERAIALRNGLSAPERLHLIPLGLDADEISFLTEEEARVSLSEACSSPLAGRVIGTVANAYPAKDLPNLMSAFARLASEAPDAELVILGDGPEMPKLRALQAALPCRRRMHLPGAVRGAARLLKGFDVFALASSKEGLPWAVLEASRAGLPIVATCVGAMPDIVEDGISGLLVPPSDAAALSKALLRALQDDVLRLKLKNGAPRIAGRRSGADMAEETMALYRTCLSRRR